MQGAFVWGLFGDACSATASSVEVGEGIAPRSTCAVGGVLAADADVSFDNDSLFLLLMIRRLNSMNSVVATCTARLFYAAVSLVHVDAISALLGTAGETQQQLQQGHDQQRGSHQLEEMIISRLNCVLQSMASPASISKVDVSGDSDAVVISGDESAKFDAVRSTVTTTSLISLWNLPSSPCLTLRGCSERPFAMTLLKVLERALDDSCPHDLLLMVTGIYAKLGEMGLDGILELFVDGSGGSSSGKNVVSVLEQLSVRAKVRWSSLSKTAGLFPSTIDGKELNDDQRFVRSCATIVQFCNELKACVCSNRHNAPCDKWQVHVVQGQESAAASG